VAAAARPLATTLALLLVNAILTLLFIALGELLFDDPAEFFRELMPGTWLSAVQLLFVAAIAMTIQHEAIGTRKPRFNNFWGLSAVVFAVFALDEITQATVFLSRALEGLGTLAPDGFKDLDAFLLTVLFLVAAAVLLRYLRDLLPHRTAIAVLAVGVLLGVASEALDATFKSTSSEFVAEESLKLAAEPFLIGGYLLVLHRFRVQK
jgi:hypothetical protein